MMHGQKNIKFVGMLMNYMHIRVQVAKGCASPVMAKILI